MPPGDPAFAECRACLGSALRRANRAVAQYYETAFRGSGMRATQFTILVTLTQTGALTMSQLAERLGLERTTLTRNLRPLESHGWVRAASDEADLRRRRVELTAAGRAAAARALPAWRRAQAGVGPVLARFGVRLAGDRGT